jgi:hypothetical protein
VHPVGVLVGHCVLDFSYSSLMALVDLPFVGTELMLECGLVFS